MKKYLLAASLLAVVPQLSQADVMPKDAYKAMLNLFAYDADGKLLRSGTAFYINAQGEAATSYALLKGASRAEVIDAKGKKHTVSRILGANATTDLVKFSTDNAKPTDFFRIAEAPVQSGAACQLVHYTPDKKKALQDIQISGDEAYNSYRYYQISATNEPANMACPLIDTDGTLFAVVQRNVNNKAMTACAIDARFLNELSITPTSALNTDLRAIFIPKALPASAKDAQTYIFMMPKSDSTALLTAYNDFIAAYPSLPDGYVNRAAYHAEQKLFKQAEADYTAAFQKAAADTTGMKADAVHYNLSNLIYRNVVAKNDTLPVFDNWTLSRAASEAARAYKLQPYTLYLVQEGNCRYAQGHFDEAYQCYSKACEDKKYVSSETFFSAARALERTGRDSARVISLLDSCIARLPQPVSARYAQYYLERSQRLIKAQRYREAVFDYNEYEKLIGPRNLNDRFYYLRHLAEVEAHMYQQALDDLHTAIATSRTPLPYRLEEAYLLLRVGELKPAAEAAAKLLKDLPENPDCYRIIGIAQGELGNKAEARKNLTKAKELGDDSVAPLIEKYQ